MPSALFPRRLRASTVSAPASITDNTPETRQRTTINETLEGFMGTYLHTSARTPRVYTFMGGGSLDRRPRGEQSPDHHCAPERRRRLSASEPKVAAAADKGRARATIITLAPNEPAA